MASAVEGTPTSGGKTRVGGTRPDNPPKNTPDNPPNNARRRTPSHYGLPGRLATGGHGQPRQLAGTVALVTGASSGIGEATALALAAAGVLLIITGRDEERLTAVSARTDATALPADLTEAGAVDELTSSALQVHGRIDLLICNAGVGWAGPISEIPAATAAELTSVNLLAPVQFARLLLPGMIARRAGHLVFVSSIAGATGVRNEAVYAATKAGLNSLAESLRYELAGSGVGVSVILPGAVDTQFFSRRGMPYAQRRGWPAPIASDHVARAVISAVTQHRAEVYVPGWLRFPAWLHGAAPRTYRLLASRLT
jgi:short-subunit dehydrogenase